MVVVEGGVGFLFGGVECGFEICVVFYEVYVFIVIIGVGF